MKLFAASVLCGLATAQQVVWERTGVPAGSRLGGVAKFIGDVNQDGFDDLVTAVDHWERPVIWSPELWILSGRDGSTLRVFTLPPNRDIYLDAWGPAGDWDGDGTPDVAYSYYENLFPRPNFLEVRSGSTGMILLTIRHPQGPAFSRLPELLGGRDLTGDGRPDIVGKWPLDAGAAVIAAYDNTGRPLYRLEGNASTPQTFTVGVPPSGNSAGWVGDLDRDGIQDFALGSLDNTLGNYVTLVLSGRTGAILVSGRNENQFTPVGWSVDGCGDVDGDGVPDFAAASALGPGRVQIFSGRTGQTLRTWAHNVAGVTSPGEALRGGGLDHDLDGVPDILFHRSIEQAGSGVYVSSARDGQWLGRILFCATRGGTSRSCAYTNFGYLPLDTGRPQPTSPYPVFVFPEPYYGRWQSGKNEFFLGRIRMYRSSPAGTEPFGTPCAGTLPTAPRIGIRNLEGRAARLHVTGAPPAAHVALVLGLSRNQWGNTSLPYSLAPWGIPGCSLFTSIELFAKTTCGTGGLDRGFAAVDIPLPLVLPGAESLVVHGQWLVLDPGTLGFGVSDALLWRH